MCESREHHTQCSLVINNEIRVAQHKSEAGREGEEGRG